MDLLIVIIISLIFIPIIIFTSNIVRIILGLLFVLFFPGYILVAALYPKKDTIGGFERVALSFGLSIAIVPLIALALNYTPWGINPVPCLISILIYMLIILPIAWYRRQRVPETSRFKINFDRICSFKFSELAKSMVPKNRWNKILTTILVIVILGTIGAITYVSVTPKPADLFTEFYILDEQGTAANYPDEVTLGEDINVIVGIINNEEDAFNYRLQININGESVTQLGPIILSRGEKWEQPFSLAPTHSGSNQKVEFLLYVEGSSEPYHTLYLWVTVKDPET